MKSEATEMLGEEEKYEKDGTDLKKNRFPQALLPKKGN